MLNLFASLTFFALIQGAVQVNAGTRLEVNVNQEAKSVVLVGACNEVEEAENAFLVANSMQREARVSSVGGTRCEMDVSSRLSKTLNKVSWERGQVHSNCWGFALAVKGVISEPRYMESFEFSFWLESPLCKPVDEPQPGDLGVIRDSAGREVHTFIYLTPSVRYSKLGPSGMIKFENDTQKIAFMTGNTNLSYFNCSSVSDFSEGKVSTSGKIGKLKSKIDSLATSVLETINDTKYRGATSKYYDGSIDQELALIEIELLSFQPNNKLERIYHRFLRVRFVELRRRITNIQMWELSKTYGHFTDFVYNNGEPARSKIVAQLTKELGVEFMAKYGVSEKLIIKDHSPGGSKVFANIMLNTIELETEQAQKVMAVIRQFPEETFTIIDSAAIPYLGLEFIIRKYEKRNDDLKLESSPYR